MPDKNINEIFCENLKEQLSKNNLTYSDLAKALGISKSTVSMWITGKNLPRMDLLDKIADYLGITVSELTTEHSTGQTGYYLNDETREIAQAVFENPDLRSLFDMSRKMPPERLKTHIDFIQRLYEQETEERIESTSQPLKRGVSYDALTSEPLMDEERPNIEGHTEN